ncbi:MAG TPA: TMEM175 family protein [Acidimicrobiales bacterium]|nr:TMEM175 family protein [Acidimicrobiales bacterium]
MTTGRLEAFSDGVLAIIITIMVLELKVPEGHTLSALRHTTGTSLLTYLLSFIYIGIYWNNHHHMFHVVDEVRGGVLWANLALLFCLSLFPFTTAWLDETHLAQTPVVVYGIDLLAAAVAYFVLQSVVIRVQGPHSALRGAVGRDLKGKLSPILYLCGIASALAFGGDRWGVWLALGFFVVVALMWLVPDRRIDRHLRQAVPGRPGRESAG